MSTIPGCVHFGTTKKGTDRKAFVTEYASDANASRNTVDALGIGADAAGKYDTGVTGALIVNLLPHLI